MLPHEAEAELPPRAFLGTFLPPPSSFPFGALFAAGCSLSRQTKQTGLTLFMSNPGCRVDLQPHPQASSFGGYVHQSRARPKYTSSQNGELSSARPYGPPGGRPQLPVFAIRWARILVVRVALQRTVVSDVKLSNGDCRTSSAKSLHLLSQVHVQGFRRAADVPYNDRHNTHECSYRRLCLHDTRS